MNIEDNWFSKAMLFKILAQNQSTQSLNKSVNDGFSKLFAAVLDNIITESEDGTTVNPIANFNLPNLGSPISVDPSSQVMTEDSNVVASDQSLRFKQIDPEQLNKMLSGKLAGKGEAFVRAGEWYNINPALLVAISKHETGNGSSHAANVKNNIAGMMGVNGLKTYPSVEESIMDMARNLSKNYLDKGLSSISKIAAKYAPIGANNDPTNLNQNWVSGVSTYFNQILV